MCARLGLIVGVLTARYKKTMRTLHHLWLSPFCRKVRLVLNEKRLDFQMRTEAVWERNEDFLKLNPVGEVPVLIEADGTALSDSAAICEFLDEVHPEPALIGHQAVARAEARRLVYWFDHKFHVEVTKNLVDEKITKRFLGLGEPVSKAIRAGHANIHHHLDYIGYLADRRRWLAGDYLSVADLAAAAHLSCVDYLGMCRGSSIPLLRTGTPESNPDRASGPCWMIISQARRLRSTMLISTSNKEERNQFLLHK